MATANLKIKEIAELISKLTDADQDALLKALKVQIVLADARRLDQSVKKNKVSMDEILQVVRQVRVARHADS